MKPVKNHISYYICSIEDNHFLTDEHIEINYVVYDKLESKVNLSLIFTSF